MSYKITGEILSFCCAFDPDWASDLALVAQLMMIVLFDCDHAAGDEVATVRAVGQKWSYRYKRYLLHKYSHSRNKAFYAFRASLSCLADFASI